MHKYIVLIINILYNFNSFLILNKTEHFIKKQNLCFLIDNRDITQSGSVNACWCGGAGSNPVIPTFFLT